MSKNMARLFLLLFLSCSIKDSTKTHAFEIIELKEYYIGKGAIIPANSPSYFIGYQVKKKITPTKEQVRRAEKILNEDIFNFYKKLLNDGKTFFYSYDSVRTSEDSLKFLIGLVDKERKKIRKYYRQYLGYVNYNNEEVILISLFNYSTSEARDSFKDWQDEYYIGSGGNYEEYQDRYLINLTRGEIDYTMTH